MTGEPLDVLNRRTAVAAVHAEAARIGVDADQLLDSNDFYTRVTALDPDAPGYHRRVQEMVDAAAGRHADAARQDAEPQRGASPAPRQWTDEDVEQATPAQTMAAMEAGLLNGLGVGAPRRRRGHR